MFDKTKRGKVSIISLFIPTDFRSITFSGPLLIFIGSKAQRHQVTTYILKQECIPVGCVPPTFYRTRGLPDRGPPDRDTLDRDTHPLDRDTHPLDRDTHPLDRDITGDRPPRQRPPWTETPWTETPWTETPWTETPWTETPRQRTPGQRPP